jgi:hypothetical protein
MGDVFDEYFIDTRTLGGLVKESSAPLLLARH